MDLRDPPAQTEEVEGQSTDNDISQNEPETQPIGSLEFTPPPLVPDDIEDDETTWGFLHPSNSFRFKPLTLRNNQYIIGKGISSDFVIKEDNLNESLPLSAISRKQFKIFKGYMSDSLNEVPQLEDLSMNGTFVNKSKVGVGKRVVLSCGDEICLVNQHSKVYTFLDTTVITNWISSEMKKIYSVRVPLGSGAFGEVKLAQNKLTGKYVAIKKIKKLDGKEKKVYNEVKILQNLKHPCVVSFEQVFETKDSLFIVLEYISGGELARRLNEEQKMTDFEVKAIFYQLALAIQYLHQKGVAHRDLKPQNVLLCAGNNNNSERLVKVSDFGLSKLVDSNTDLKTFCGTVLYTAPEILITHGTGVYTHQVDVWSLGVILFQCLSGKLPFSKERGPVPVIEQILRASYSMTGANWRGVNSGAASLVRKMLKADPKCRITVDEILQHPWLKDEGMRRKVEKLMRETSPGTDENLYIDVVRAAKRPRLSDGEEDTVRKS